MNNNSQSTQYNSLNGKNNFYEKNVQNNNFNNVFPYQQMQMDPNFIKFQLKNNLANPNQDSIKNNQFSNNFFTNNSFPQQQTSNFQNNFINNHNISFMNGNMNNMSNFNNSYLLKNQVIENKFDSSKNFNSETQFPTTNFTNPLNYTPKKVENENSFLNIDEMSQELKDQYKLFCLGFLQHKQHIEYQKKNSGDIKDQSDNTFINGYEPPIKVPSPDYSINPIIFPTPIVQNNYFSNYSFVNTNQDQIDKDKEYFDKIKFNIDKINAYVPKDKKIKDNEEVQQITEDFEKIIVKQDKQSFRKSKKGENFVDNYSNNSIYNMGNNKGKKGNKNSKFSNQDIKNNYNNKGYKTKIIDDVFSNPKVIKSEPAEEPEFKKTPISNPQKEIKEPEFKNQKDILQQMQYMFFMNQMMMMKQASYINQNQNNNIMDIFGNMMKKQENISPQNFENETTSPINKVNSNISNTDNLQEEPKEEKIMHNQKNSINSMNDFIQFCMMNPYDNPELMKQRLLSINSNYSNDENNDNYDNYNIKEFMNKDANTKGESAENKLNYSNLYNSPETPRLVDKFDYTDPFKIFLKEDETDYDNIKNLDEGEFNYTNYYNTLFGGGGNENNDEEDEGVEEES